MARTYKDRPSRIQYPEDQWDYRYDEENYWGIYLKRRGVLTKKRRDVDTNWHWMTTPSWWTRLMMNRPQRVCSKQWERMVVRGSIDSLEDADAPPLGKKPHIYYW